MMSRIVCGLAGGLLTIPVACDRVEVKGKEVRERPAEGVLKGKMTNGELEEGTAV